MILILFKKIFCRRIRASGLPVVRNSKTIGRYTSLEHSAQSPNPLRYVKNKLIVFYRDCISDNLANMSSPNREKNWCLMLFYCGFGSKLLNIFIA